jgi:hypothetical protein
MRHISKRLAMIVGALAIVTAMAAAPASKGVEKARLFAGGDTSCAAGALTTTGTSYGKVLFNAVGKDGATLLVVFQLRTAEPSTAYDLYVRQSAGGCDLPKVGSVVTDETGNGTFQVRMPRVSGATTAWGEARPTGHPVLHTPAVAMR